MKEINADVCIYNGILRITFWYALKGLIYMLFNAVNLKIQSVVSQPL